MNSNLKAVAGAAFLIFALASSASATTVFSEPLATPTPTAQYSLVGGQQEASQFTLGSTTDITGATFYGAGLGGALPSDFTIQFFSSLNNLPLSELYSANATGTAVSAGVTDNYGAPVFAITTSFTPFTALAGVHYFFAASDVAGNGYNFVVESSSSGVGAQTGGGIGNYYSLGYSEAFSLSATSAVPAGVPEPASWAMMLVGFGGLGAVMRRRQTYRLVEIVADGRTSSETFRADDDQSALAQALGVAEGVALEVWRDDALVTRCDLSGLAAA